MIDDFYLDRNSIYTLSGFSDYEENKRTLGKDIIREFDTESLKKYELESDNTPMKRFFTDLNKALLICLKSTNRVLFSTFLDDIYRIRPIVPEKIIPLKSEIINGVNYLKVNVNDSPLDPLMPSYQYYASLYFDTDFILRYMKFYPERYYSSDFNVYRTKQLPKIHKERKDYKEYLINNFREEGFEQMNEKIGEGNLIFDGYLKPPKEVEIKFKPEYILAFNTFNIIGNELFMPSQVKYGEEFTITQKEKDEFEHLDIYDVYRTNDEVKEMMKEEGAKDLYHLRKRSDDRVIVDESNQKNVKLNVKSVLKELHRHRNSRNFYKEYYNNIIDNFF